MISFSQNATVSNIEEALEQLREPPNVVRVPTKLKYGGTFGITGAIAQFLATWARGDESAEVKLYGNAEEDDATSSLAQEPHGICTLYFAKTLNLLRNRSSVGSPIACPRNISTLLGVCACSVWSIIL
jgi:hypothetical protein